MSISDLDASIAREIVSQREFPTLASIVVALSFGAIQDRNATEITITICSQDELTITDNGQCHSVDSLRALWRSICGVANVRLETWPGLQTAENDILHGNALMLQNGWISFLPEDHANVNSTSSGCSMRVFDLFARLAVRRRLREHADAHIEQLELRKCLQRLALIAPFAAVRCDVKQGPWIFAHAPCPSTVQSFAAMFGESRVADLNDVVVNGASALISSSGNGLHHSKELQFVFFKSAYACPLEDAMKDCLNTAFRERRGREFLNLTSARNRTMYLTFVVCLDPMHIEHASRSQLNKLANQLLDVSGWEHAAGGGGGQDSKERRRVEHYPETPFGRSKNDIHGDVTHQQHPKERTILPTLPSTALSTRSSMKLSRDVIMNAEFVGQVNDEFLILKKRPEGTLLIVDQHAADERIRFERFQRDVEEARQMNDIVTGKADSPFVSTDDEEDESRHIVISPLLRITPLERDRLIRGKAECEAWGFRWMFQSDLQIIVEYVPVLHGAKLSPLALLEIVNNMDDNAALPLPFRRMLASKACRGAIMFGQPLAVDECERLVRDLSLCNLPFQCAHGRPSVVPAGTQLY